MKFVANNQVVKIKADPNAMHMYQLTSVGQALITPSFQNHIPILSSIVMTSNYIVSHKKES